MTTLVKPDLPGTYIHWSGEQTVRPSPSISATVAVPIVHDWGPLGADSDGVVLVNSFQEFEAAYGNSDTGGRDAVLGAFVGQGLPGEAAAGGVYVYRMATGSAARASRTLTNVSAATPALRLRAKYTGDRGERIDVTVDSDPVTPANDRLRVYFDDALVETYSYPETDIAALGAAINNRPSRYVDADGPAAAAIVTGTALTAIAHGALTGGDNGDALTSTEWVAALDALEFRPFTILAPYNLTDTGIQATLLAWLQEQEAAQRPVVGVIGAPSSEDTLDESLTRVGSLRDPHLLSLAGGIFHDDFLDKDVNTAQLAPRVAGALAGRGEEKALTNARFAGLSAVGTPGVPGDRLKEAIDAGLIAFRRTEATDADLMIAQAVTTFNSDTDDDRPRDIFSNPRFVRVMDLFLRTMKRYGDNEIAGVARVTEETRAAVRAKGTSEINNLRGRRLIEEDPAPYFVVNPPPEDVPDAVPFEFGWMFTRDTSYLVGDGKVR